ncbi:MAG: hypothetical protein QG608_1365 [Actinomycetota bacterium]|nr:hypothetical protein [Actinomycetota bacterium]
MEIRRRRAGLPAESVRALGLTRKDKILAWSHLAGEGTAAATTTRLLVLTPYGTVSSAAWTDIRQAIWDRSSQTLGVWLVGVRNPLGLEMVGGSRLPDVVQEQVQSSVVLSRRVALPGGSAAVVAVRRRADGALVAQTLWPDSLSDPASRDRSALRAVRIVIDDLREETGMTGEPEVERPREHSRFGVAASL